MSGASTSANTSTTKATTDESPATQNLPEQSTNKKPQLEEDDEFEDFPVEDWGDEETDAAQPEQNSHLWEESWDDDDTNDDFSKQLQEEIKKVDSGKR